MRKQSVFISQLGKCVPLGDGHIFLTSLHPYWNSDFVPDEYDGRNQIGLRIIPTGHLELVVNSGQYAGYNNNGFGFNVAYLTATWDTSGAYTALKYIKWFAAQNTPSYQKATMYIITSPISANVAQGFAIKACKTDNSNLRDLTIIKDAYTDGNGHKYDAIKIGTRLWTINNIKATKAQSGTNLVKFNGNINTWISNSYAEPSSDTGVDDNYGYLYHATLYIVENLITANGFRVPTQADWENTLQYLVDKVWCDGKVITSSNIGIYVKSGRVKQRATSDYVQITGPNSITFSSSAKTNDNTSIYPTHRWQSVKRTIASWFIIDEDAEPPAGDIRYSATENTSIIQRSVIIDFYSYSELLLTCTFIQQGASYSFSITPSTINTNGLSNQLFIVSVSSTHPWSVFSVPSWIDMPIGGVAGTYNINVWVFAGDSASTVIDFNIEGVPVGYLSITRGLM